MSLSNLLSSIQNGQRKRILVVRQPRSKMAQSILNVLQEKGFLRGYRYTDKDFEILLKYKNHKPAINEIHLISKPSKRVYKKWEDIQKMRVDDRPLHGMWIFSTCKGMLDQDQAIEYHVGGELICYLS